MTNSGAGMQMTRCVNFQGTSVRELKRAFKESVDDYFEVIKSARFGE